MIWVKFSFKNSCSLPTCLLDPSDSWDYFCMKFVKTLRVHWSWRCYTNMNYCCLRSLTQHSISNNKIVWGNEAAFARQPESVRTASGEMSIWSTFLSQFHSFDSHSLIFLHSQALASLQDRRESLCLLLRKSSLLSPKTLVRFLSWAVRELIISAVLLAAFLLLLGTGRCPSTGKPRRGWSFPSHVGCWNWPNIVTALWGSFHVKSLRALPERSATVFQAPILHTVALNLCNKMK